MKASTVEGMIKTMPATAEQEESSPVLIEASGDKDVGSPSVSIAATCPERGTLSSPQDDSSMDEGLCGERIEPVSILPISKQPTSGCFGRCLTKKKWCSQGLHNLT